MSSRLQLAESRAERTIIERFLAQCEDRKIEAQASGRTGGFADRIALLRQRMDEIDQRIGRLEAADAH